jgi:hypothetical protein
MPDGQPDIHDQPEFIYVISKEGGIDCERGPVHTPCAGPKTGEGNEWAIMI